MSSGHFKFHLLVYAAAAHEINYHLHYSTTAVYTHTTVTKHVYTAAVKSVAEYNYTHIIEQKRGKIY